MSHVLEAILQRRAIKVFDPVEIPDAVREQILDAARSAPSSFNMQPYRFYWVKSPEIKRWPPGYVCTNCPLKPPRP